MLASGKLLLSSTPSFNHANPNAQNILLLMLSQNFDNGAGSYAAAITQAATAMRNAGIPVLSIGIKIPRNGGYVADYNLNELSEISCNCAPCNRVWEVEGLPALAQSNFLGAATCEALNVPISCGGG